MRDEDGRAGEVGPVGGDLLEGRGGGDHRVAYPRESDDEGRDWRARVDERLELGDDAPGTDARRADLHDARGRHLRPRRLDVEDDELGLGERATPVILAEHLGLVRVFRDSYAPVLADQLADERCGERGFEA